MSPRPNLIDPYGSDPQDTDPWNDPGSSVDPGSLGRAAMWVWIVAAIEIALTGCCVTGLVELGGMAPDQVDQLMAERGADERQTAAVAQFQPLAKSMAAGVGTMGLLPAMLLAGTAFGVARGRRWAIVVCALIVLVQLFVAGVFMLMAVAVAFAGGQPAQFTIVVIVVGSVIAALGFTLKQLLAAWHGAAPIGG